MPLLHYLRPGQLAGSLFFTACGTLLCFLACYCHQISRWCETIGRNVYREILCLFDCLDRSSYCSIELLFDNGISWNDWYIVCVYKKKKLVLPLNFLVLSRQIIMYTVTANNQ